MTTIGEIRDAIYTLVNHVSITSLLAPAPAGRTTSIFHEQAPDNAVTPWVIIDKQSGTPANRAMKGAEDQNDIWLIEGVSKGSADKAEKIADAILARVQDAPISIPGMTVLWLRRETDVDFWQTVEGDRWDYVGYQFRLVGEPT